MQDESLATAPPGSLREMDAAQRAARTRPGARSEPPGVHTRVRHGMARPHNWLQLLRFCFVGGTGFFVNLMVFALATGVLGVHYLAAAALAYAVAVTNNFLLNRHWTFRARRGHAGFQAARFFAVSTAAALLAAAVLELLVSVGGVAEIPAQAIAVASAMPLNFVGNKMWSFGRSSSRA